MTAEARDIVPGAGAILHDVRIFVIHIPRILWLRKRHAYAGIIHGRLRLRS